MSSIRKNFLYQTLYQLLTIIIPIITTPYISRHLGADGIGEYSFYYSIANYFAIFILLGLNTYGNRLIAQSRGDHEKLRKAFWSAYSMQFICGTIVIAFYFLYCCYLASDKLLAFIFGIYILSTVFDISWFFFGMEEFKMTVTKNIIIKLLTTISIFLLVKEKSHLYRYSMILVLGMIIGQVIMWPRLFKELGIVRINKSDICKHIRPNLILFITVLATSLFKIMDKIMLGAMTSSTQVGYYECSERIIAIPTALVISLGTIMLPRMSRIVSEGKEVECNKLVSSSIQLAMFFSTSIGFGIMSVAEQFVPLFYGEGYSTCIVLYYILLPSCIFLAFANVIRTQILLPHKKDIVYIKSAFIGAFVNLSINCVLIPKYGAIGAAIGTFFAELAVCLVQVLSVRKEITLSRYIRDSIPFILSGIIMFIVELRIRFFEQSVVVALVLKIIIGAAIYLFILAIFHFIYKILFKDSFISFCGLK